MRYNLIYYLVQISIVYPEMSIADIETVFSLSKGKHIYVYRICKMFLQFMKTFKGLVNYKILYLQRCCSDSESNEM